MTILIRRTEICKSLPDPDVRAELPRTWTSPHVALRLAEGFAWSAMEHDHDRLGFRTSWPPTLDEIDDLDAQAEQRELERNTPAVLDNFVRIAPSSRDISRCNVTLYWPMKYLMAHPHLAEAVNRVALARAHGRDAGHVARERGGNADEWRARHDRGCEIIARGLRKDGVVVF